ncbi:MAG: heavy metal translocating P-type ATPase [Rhodospirillales bacterium]
MNVVTLRDQLPGFASEGTADQESCHFMVEKIHCAGCIKKIENTLRATPGILDARVNLSTKRLRVSLAPDQIAPEVVANLVTELGFPARSFDADKLAAEGDRQEKALLKAMAVAGFAAANVMLLSVSVWSGHFSGMDDTTRTLFHWLSALIALPAVGYAGMPFFQSAASALRARSLNMDVPISLAVLLAVGMSVQQTVKGAEHAYFDASVTLLFFLLIGRYLDHRARSKARSVATRLLGLRAGCAVVVSDDGKHMDCPVDQLALGMVVQAASGERLPADGKIIDGETELDAALITGESMPQPVAPGATVHAGTINLGAPVLVRVTAVGEDTLLAEIVRLMEAAEQGRARYVRLADRAARIYAPAVHIVAGLAFVGWFVAGAGWEYALLIAIATLIITCPCALGLAVPVVQVVATGRLMSKGILLKSGDGLERLFEIDEVVFDKTGTLTIGTPVLTNADEIPPGILLRAAALAAKSRHPLAQALASSAPSSSMIKVEQVSEQPGFGLEGVIDGHVAKLGKQEWAGNADDAELGPSGPEVWYSEEGIQPIRFTFADQLRPDAEETVARLQAMGLGVSMLSGDRADVVRVVADRLNIASWRADLTPDEKVKYLSELAKRGVKVLMVGDGLNDAPALAAGHASMSPATGADVSQAAADFVFQGQNLSAVIDAVSLARRSTRMVKQNFALAFMYNVIAVPLAVAGYATPLVAAIAMSSSSILVTLNALRLRLAERDAG